MRNQAGFNLTALALLAPIAAANGGEDLDRVHVPALKNVTVTASPGKGITFDAGDEFKLNIYNRVQVAWQFSERDNGNGAQMTFRVRRARTKFKGHAFSPETQFQIYLEWATSGNNLLDAFIRQELWANDQWTLHARAGAGKPGYGKEFTGSSGKLEFVDRSVASRTFSGQRTTGLIFSAAGMEGKFNASIGIHNNDPAAGNLYGSAPNTANADNKLDYHANIRYDVNGDMGGESYAQGDLDHTQQWNASFHASLWVGNATAGAGDVDVLAINAGGAFKLKGVHALVEVFFHNAEAANVPTATDSEAMGWNGQVSYTLQNGWGFALRGSMVSVDRLSTGATQYIAPASGGLTSGGTALSGTGDVTEITLGINKYFNGHGRKVQADVTFQTVESDTTGVQDADNIIFRIQATLAV